MDLTTCDSFWKLGALCVQQQQHNEELDNKDTVIYYQMFYIFHHSLNKYQIKNPHDSDLNQH